jgi:hypothetical protein
MVLPVSRLRLGSQTDNHSIASHEEMMAQDTMQAVLRLPADAAAEAWM